jgi:hypothetical protein
VVLMDLHAVVANVEGGVRRVQKIVSEVFLDDISFIAAADQEFMYPMCGKKFHHVPENRFAPNFDHWFGSQMTLLTDASSEAACQYDCFQVQPFLSCVSKGFGEYRFRVSPVVSTPVRSGHATGAFVGANSPTLLS